MKTLGHFTFPETSDETANWDKTLRSKALARRVLAVAITRVEGTWKAYCDAVPGRNHANEYHAVLAEGLALPENLALVIFPQFEGIPYAR